MRPAPPPPGRLPVEYDRLPSSERVGRDPDFDAAVSRAVSGAADAVFWFFLVGFCAVGFLFAVLVGLALISASTTTG